MLPRLQHKEMHIAHTQNLRRLRQSLPALITACCANREPFFLNPACAQIVLDELLWLDARHRIILFAAVVMPDHIHFVADPLGADWAATLHSLKRHTARSINRLLDRSGSVWQRQYHDRQLRSDDHIAAAIRYCALNPLRAGLVSADVRYPYFWSRFGEG